MAYWYQKNLRFLQTVLRAIDIVNYDAKGVVDYMRKANANVLVVNAGGVMDFFDNPLEMSKKNPFMKEGQDILKDVCEEIHKAGMHVIVRVDFRGVEKERYEKHPDWFAKDAHGNPKTTQYATELFHSPCYLGYYANEHGEEYVRYLMKEYDLDGIWENAVSFGTDICYCDRCKQRFLKDTGKELPILTNKHGQSHISMFSSNNDYYLPDFDEYRLWKAKCADEHIQRIRNATKAFGEDKAYSAEIFDIYNSVVSKRSSIGHENAKRHFDYLISCVFMDASFAPEGNPTGRAYGTINDAGTTIRLSRALQQEKQAVINTGGNGTRARYVCDPLLETRLWLWEIVSVGGGVWNCYFNGQHPDATHDRRAAYSEKDAYTFLSQNSDVISGSVPVKDVAMFYSVTNLDRFGSIREEEDDFENHFRGAERVLIENHIPYGFVVGDESFTLEKLSGVKTLILPNAGILTQNQMDIIRQYVENGGGLIASYESSLYNKDGSKREDFGLADVFGCNYSGESIPTINDYYFKVKDAASPVFEQLGNTELIMSSGKTAMSVAKDNSEQVAGFLPKILNQPPEYAWIKEMDSPNVGIMARNHGKGRVVYFANTTDALCFENGHEDFTEIYGNALHFTSKKDYHITTNAPRSVHINLLQEDSNGKTNYIMSFINTTGTQQRPIKELIPVGPFEVKLHLNGKKFVESKLLWNNAKVSQEGNAVVVSVEKLEEFASVQIVVQ